MQVYIFSLPLPLCVLGSINNLAAAGACVAESRVSTYAIESTSELATRRAFPSRGFTASQSPASRCARSASAIN